LKKEIFPIKFKEIKRNLSMEFNGDSIFNIETKKKASTRGLKKVKNKLMLIKSNLDLDSNENELKVLNQIIEKYSNEDKNFKNNKIKIEIKIIESNLPYQKRIDKNKPTKPFYEIYNLELFFEYNKNKDNRKLNNFLQFLSVSNYLKILTSIEYKTANEKNIFLTNQKIIRLNSFLKLEPNNQEYKEDLKRLKKELRSLKNNKGVKSKDLLNYLKIPDTTLSTSLNILHKYGFIKKAIHNKELYVYSNLKQIDKKTIELIEKADKEIYLNEKEILKETTISEDYNEEIPSFNLIF
jgi:hypothetical protein